MRPLINTLLVVFYVCTIGFGDDAKAQTPDKFPPIEDSEIRRIEAVKTSQPIVIDGKLDEPAWQTAAKSPRFVDLVSGQPTIHDTRVQLLWDEEYLYIGYTIEEPDVQADLTERDSPIYNNNDVEFFIAGEDAYYEFEINALGTIYEGLFVWQSVYEASGISEISELDRRNPEVKSQAFNGVGFNAHPRGPRWAFLAWDYPQAKTAVHIDGTLNDSSDRDRGWTVELAFPWRELAVLNKSVPRSLPPATGDVWRMDFSRFNQYKEAPKAGENKSLDSGGWALSYHGVWDSHIPECFPFVTFVETKR